MEGGGSMGGRRWVLSHVDHCHHHHRPCGPRRPRRPACFGSNKRFWLATPPLAGASAALIHGQAMEASSESTSPSAQGEGIWRRSRSRSVTRVPPVPTRAPPQPPGQARGPSTAPKRQGKIPKNRPVPTRTPARPSKARPAMAKPSEAIQAKAMPKAKDLKKAKAMTMKAVANAIMEKAKASHYASGATANDDAAMVLEVTPPLVDQTGAAPVGQPGAAPAGQPAGQCPQGGTAWAAADVPTGHGPRATDSGAAAGAGAAGAAEGPAAAPAQPADAAGSSTGQLGARGRIPRAGLSPAEWAACPWRLGQPGPYDWEIP